MKTINVVDAVMGAGKTTFALSYIEAAPADQKFIYITPFLDEIQRVISTVKSRTFVEPTVAAGGGRKLNALKRQIEDGENIAATHSLFEMADDELISLLQASNYTLVLDEVMDVISKASVSPSDMRLLLAKKYIEVNNKRIQWIAPEIEYEYGVFDNIKLLAQAGNLYYHRDKYLIWAFPPSVFEAFDNVFILTYLFNAQIQRYYFDLYGIPFKLHGVKDGELSEYDVRADKRLELLGLIELYEGDHNIHGESYFSFSRGWMDRRTKEDLEAIQKSIYSYVRRVTGAKSKDVLWTTLKAYQFDLQGKGYSKGFLSNNIRATNDFADRSVLIYAYSRFMTPYEKSFFQDQGVTVNEELLALSDMLQWIWRSCIRNGQPIKVYIPSSRMRGLLKTWAEYKI